MNKTRWQQIEDLYHAALDRPLIERTKFLSDKCSGDAELFSEVESLLSSSDADDSFMATPEFDLGLKILAKPDHVLKSDQDFGHYRIRDFLGRGGMGEVYLAEDTKLGRPVALKVLPADVASNQERIRRFIQEARAASALNHPNILTIHEIGEADGWRFIASEFVEGKNLRECLRGEETPAVTDVIEISVQIAAALNAAHKVGIVHRDIKPENIMLREDGLVKVLDFGLAKLIETPDSQNSTTGFASTNPGMVMGTIAYMSPEQTRGKKTDARSDIWSLGVVLYEMLTGRLPFGGDTSSDMIAAILTTEPALPENETWMPESLWRIIAKALRKKPDERYPSANDMANDLRGVFSDADTAPSGGFHKPTDFKLIGGTDPAFVPTGEAFRRSQPESIQARWSGYKVGLAVASVLAVVLVGGFAGFSLLKNSAWLARDSVSDREQPITSIAVLPFVNESGDPEFEYLTDGLTETLIRSLSQVPGLSVKARTSVFQYKGKDIDPRIVGKELSAQAVLIGRVLKKDNRLTLSYELVDATSGNVIVSDRYDRSQDELFSIQNDILMRISGALHAESSTTDSKRTLMAHAGNREAYELYLKGRYYWNRRTNDDFKKAIDYFQKAIKIDPDFALAYSGLSDSYALLVAWGGASPHDAMAPAKAAALKALALDENLAEGHASLGQYYDYEYDSEGAEREYKRAIELNPSYASAYQWYAESLSLKGRFDDAHVAIRRAIELDPLSRIIRHIEGRIYFFSGQNDEAIAILKKNIDLDPTWGGDHDLLFLVYEAKGMYPEAVDAYIKSLTLFKLAPPSEIQLTHDSFVKSGWKGFLRHRVRYLEEQSKREYVKPAQIAEFYARLGEKDKAFAALHKALDNKSPGLNWVKYLACFDGIRSDPRYIELIRRIDRLSAS